MIRQIICVDMGASQMTMAEFTPLKPAGIELTSFAVRPVGQEPGSDTDFSAYVVSTIRDIMRENSIKPGKAIISVSGKDIFPRYINLPPVTSDKVSQIVQYEAQQNVPFPIDEVVWDYQLIQREEGGQSVMLVAIKTEVIRQLTDCIEASGLDPAVVDVAPMALYNLVRYSYGEREGCTLIVDMGARTTNLVFMEGRKIFMRSLSVAGNTITQELMKEFELPFKDAEELKIAHAFVAFGGAVEGADSQVVNRTSKTVRSVMTRLHAEISRSINFYRSQQRGSKPSLLLLTGGSSIIRETDTFLREKLGVEVEYLNPFHNISVSPNLSAEDVANNMHLLGEVSGLALRRVFDCPMEVNLMPPDLVAKKSMVAKIPFFAIAALALALSLTCWWGYYRRVRLLNTKNVAMLNAEIGQLASWQESLDALSETKDGIQKRADRLLALVGYRTRWISMIEDIHSELLDGMWLTAITPMEKMREGQLTHIRIAGMGFVDKVADEVAVGEFGSSLGLLQYFSNQVDVVRIQRPTEYSLQFTIDIPLKEPLEF
jgi:type IV pilus assembly protein PilM